MELRIQANVSRVFSWQTPLSSRPFERAFPSSRVSDTLERKYNVSQILNPENRAAYLRADVSAAIVRGVLCVFVFARLYESIAYVGTNIVISVANIMLMGTPIL